MNQLESKNRSNIRRTKLNEAVIGTIATVGIISLAVVAPNVIRVLAISRFLPQRRNEIKGVLGRMIKKDYVSLEKNASGTFVRLTKKGERFAALIESGKLQVKPRVWDKKWRVLIFDIPETRRGTRARLRALLVSLEFVRLQDSVWVSPHACEEEIMVIKAELRIGNGVRYLIADQIENDASLRKHFSLPNT